MEIEGLEELYLSQTLVRDLRPLANAHGLRKLYLASTAVTDLEPLAELTALEDLDLRNTDVTTLAPLQNLPHLKKLFLTAQQKERLAEDWQALLVNHPGLMDRVQR